MKKQKKSILPLRLKNTMNSSQYFKGSLYTKVKIKEHILFPENKKEQVKVIGLAPGYIFYKNRIYEMSHVFNGGLIKSCLAKFWLMKRKLVVFIPLCCLF